MPITIAALYKKELPPEDWIIDGLLTRRNVGFVIGPSKRGKSWMLLEAAWNLSEGSPIWGLPELKPSKPLRTVYFTQEDTEYNIQDRVKKHVDQAKREITDRALIAPKNLNMVLDDPRGIGIIKRELDDAAKIGKIDLVMFDPMRRIHRGNENDSQHIASLWERIEAIHNDYGCATIIAHHITKPPQDKEGYDPADPYHGRGSGDIYGGGDAFVMVVPGPLAPDGRSWRKVNVHFESKRGEPIPAAELKIRLSDGQIECSGRL